MKLTKFVLALACFALVFTACGDDDDDKVIPPEVSDVPEVVLKAFESKYANATDVKWEKKNDYHVARFNSATIITKAALTTQGYATSVWFSNDGSEKQADQDVPFTSLPEAVKTSFDAIKAKQYADWKTDDEADVVSRPDMGLIYIIEIEKDDKERELTFSSDGILIKDAEDKDDDEDILPVIVSDNFKTLLAGLFPDSKNLVILEIDTEDGETEIDVLDDGIHKEVKLDSKGEWISTEFDMTLPEAMALMQTVNPAILQKLVAMAGMAGVDLTNPAIIQNTEVTAVQHATRGMYFEVEIEFGGLEMELIIDKDGNITDKDGNPIPLP